MPTKTKKANSSKKGSPKRTTKKAKQAPKNKNIIVEESGQGIYTMSTVESSVDNQATDTVAPNTSVTPQLENTTVQTGEHPEVQETKKPDNSDLITENVSYNNMVVPQAKDNTVLYIGACLGIIVLLWALFA